MKRLFYALRWFWAAFRKPKVFQFMYFKLIESMMQFLADTAKQQSPMRAELRMTKLAEILYEGDKDRPFLHLWCGVNEINNPITRLAQLVEENKKLRHLISDAQLKQLQ